MEFSFTSTQALLEKIAKKPLIFIFETNTYQLLFPEMALFSNILVELLFHFFIIQITYWYDKLHLLWLRRFLSLKPNQQAA